MIYAQKLELSCTRFLRYVPMLLFLHRLLQYLPSLVGSADSGDDFISSIISCIDLRIIYMADIFAKVLMLTS